MTDLVSQLAQYAGGEEHNLIEASGAGRAPTQEELDNPIVAPGMPAMLAAAISYHAHWKKAGDGMAKHAREQVTALAQTGLPLQLRSFAQELVLNEELPAESQKLLYLEQVSSSKVALAIKQFVFHTPQLVREVLCPAAVRNTSAAACKETLSRTIAYTSWERDCVHPEIVKAMEGLGQLWVPCEENRQAFANSGFPESKIKIVPYPFDPANHTVAAPRGSEDAPVGKLFYNIGKWEPRKNQHQLIGAFLQAFTPKDRASLFIKTSEFGTWANYPSVEESVDMWLSLSQVQERGWTRSAFDRLVKIVDKQISVEDLNQIHKRNNIYVSAALGEAWDIPAFEARLAGNNMVYVGYGGPSAYCSPRDVKVSCGFGPVNRAYNWEPDARWASVETRDMIEALRVVQPPTSRQMPTDLVLRFSRNAVGTLMRSIIERRLQTIGCTMISGLGGFG